MLTPDDVVLILRLHHAGKTVAQIYGETGFAKKTILKYIRQQEKRQHSELLFGVSPLCKPESGEE